MKSPIYHSIETYRFTMKRLYGNRFENRYENLIKYIPPAKSITELCPGDGYFFEFYLKDSNPDYKAVEWNTKFSLYLRELGAEVIEGDVNNVNIPSADVVFMQGSLYQFKDYRSVLNNMYEAARELLIVSEPVKNMSQSENKIISEIAAHLSNPGDGPKHFRFTRNTLLEAAEGLPQPEVVQYPKDKEVILIFRK